MNAEMTWEQAVVSLREKPENAEIARACFYDDPLIDAARRFHASSEWAAVSALLTQKPGKMLELGAGRGVASFAFAADGWQVTALEPDPSAVVGAGAIRQLAEDGGVAIDVVEEWGERLPFADASFDLVYCRAVLHHARDLGELVREIGRVLKPGGTFFGTREHVVDRHEDIPTFQDAHPLHRLYGGEYAYLIAEYCDAMRGAGLTIDKVLNPWESDINLYPLDRGGLKRLLAGKFGLSALGGLVPDAVLRWRGDRSHEPGRLYTFVGHKPHA